MPNPDGRASIIEVKNFFGYAHISEFRKDWAQLTDEDKLQLTTGIGNGTLTY